MTRAQLQALRENFESRMPLGKSLLKNRGDSAPQLGDAAKKLEETRRRTRLTCMRRPIR
jgi:hypothetical protein